MNFEPGFFQYSDFCDIMQMSHYLHKYAVICIFEQHFWKKLLWLINWEKHIDDHYLDLSNNFCSKSSWYKVYFIVYMQHYKVYFIVYNAAYKQLHCLYAAFNRAEFLSSTFLTVKW